MSATPLWLTEAEVASLIDLGEAITSVRAALAVAGSGAAVSMPKAQIGLNRGALHATGAIDSEAGLAASKTWLHTAGGTTPIVLLWSTDDGALLAIIEAFALGQYRTGATSGVATNALAKRDARVLAMCGTGTQALMQVASVAAVRNLEQVRVWSPKQSSRENFCDEVEKALSIEAVPVDSANAAAEGADVVTLLTRSTAPFLDSSAIAEGTHVNAVGAIGLDRAEFEPALLGRCRVVAVDSLVAARAFSRELRDFYAQDDEAWRSVTELASEVASGRRSDGGTTLFKAMGTGLGDLAIARFCYDQALLNQLGLSLPVPTRSMPRLRSDLLRS